MNQHSPVVPEKLSHPKLAGGPLSLAPFSEELFHSAVVEGGGEIMEVGPATRGLVWLSPYGANELGAILDAQPQIEWLQLPWAGVDAFASVLAHIATMPVDKRPVVTSAKGAYSEPVAEHALALTLACMREFPRKARDAHWQEQRSGLSLFGRHVVVIGAGGVGRTFVELLAPFRANVTMVRRGNKSVPGAQATIGVDDLDSVLPHADVVVVAAAATESTRHLIGARQLALMPQHSVLINIARGSLVDADALLDALQSGRLFGAGLDVMDPEPFPSEHGLWSTNNALITSHSADTPDMTRPLLAQRVRGNVEAYLNGLDLLGVVDVEAGY